MISAANTTTIEVRVVYRRLNVKGLARTIFEKKKNSPHGMCKAQELKL